MRFSGLKFLLIAMAVAAVPAFGQSTIYLTNSGSNLVTFAGDGNGNVTTTLGNCSGSVCTLSGATSGTWNGSAVTGYTLTTSAATPLTGSNGNTTWTASASSLTGSTLDLTGSDGSSLFAGTLGSLVFTQESGDQVLVTATVTGAGSSSGSTLDISGVIQLDGATISAVAGSQYPVAVSGGIVPEPTSLLLFGSGLIGLGGLVRRRLSLV